MIKTDLTLSDISDKVFKKNYENIEMILKEKFPQNTGWIDLPNQTKEELQQIKQYAEEIKNNYDKFVVIGIGGSYLGARCALDMLKPDNNVIFAGTSFDAFQINEVINKCKGKKIAVNIISKSGTTLETLIAYELLKENVGIEDKAVYVTTTKDNKLDKYAKEKGFNTLYIPADVGGRYSVLSPVGLLPMAVAGIDIENVIGGALEEKNDIAKDNSNVVNYAVARKFYKCKRKKQIEILSTFKTNLHTFVDWYEQLFLESLGKNGKGLFSAGGRYSTDLHSKGQYFQEGTPNFFETFLTCENAGVDFTLKGIEEFNKELIGGKTLNQLNDFVEQSTIKAHRVNNVPMIKIICPNTDEKTLGALFYFFELVCGFNGILDNVNPFDQPGVEEYKSNLKSLLKSN